MPLTPEMFGAVLPLAVAWAEGGERYIIDNGTELTEEQKEDARLAGVRHVDKIRLCRVPQIARPHEGLLEQANDIVKLVTPDTWGLTLGYGIFIRNDGWGNRKLLVHECVHVSQYENLGGIGAFLTKYLDECIRFGYPQAPMEQQAVHTAERICGR